MTEVEDVSQDGTKMKSSRYVQVLDGSRKSLLAVGILWLVIFVLLSMILFLSPFWAAT